MLIQLASWPRPPFLNITAGPARSVLRDGFRRVALSLRERLANLSRSERATARKPLLISLRSRRPALALPALSVFAERPGFGKGRGLPLTVRGGWAIRLTPVGMRCRTWTKSRV